MINIFDLYTDYLQVSLGQTTATGLSKIVDYEISHDQITRMLHDLNTSNKALWLKVKSSVRKHESENGCLIFDDSLSHKPHTDENEIICWHYDHSSGQMVKGINILSTFYHSGGDNPLRIPVAYNVISKHPFSSDIKTKKVTRKSLVTKNELMRSQITAAINNAIKFSYVLADSWYSSGENMKFIHGLGKYFIFDLKSNRLAIIGDRNQGNWDNINKLDLQAWTPTKAWLKDLEIEVLLIKQVFTNKDGSIGVRYLVSNNLNLTREDFTDIYKKRWSVEEYHKSLKQNTSLSKSPTRIVKTQCAHIFASLIAYVKFEKYKLGSKTNHFAIKSKLYINATKSAFQELGKLKSQYLNLDDLAMAA
jgi:hypothetical protein